MQGTVVLSEADDVQLMPAPTKRCGSARARIVHLGVIFFLLFGTYLMIQAFAVTFYGDDLASNTLVALYATFTVACLFAPAVTNTLGPRPTLGLGVLSYVPIPVATLLLVTQKQDWCRVLVILAGMLSGAGGACMWTAQGRLMLEATSISGDLIAAATESTAIAVYQPRSAAGDAIRLVAAT